MKNKAAKRIALTAGILSVLAASTPPPAYGYYWGYSPYTGASNWTWLARSLMYPISRYSGSSAPMYLANSLLWTGTYAANQVVTNRQRKMLYGQYYDEEPYYQPRRRGRAVPNSPYVADQVVTAEAPDDFEPQPMPIGASGAGSPGSGAAIPNPMYQAGSPYSAGTSGGSQSIPPVAPPPAIAYSPANNGPFQAPLGLPSLATEGQIAPAQPVRAAGAPLARGFFDLVNKRFDGDISKALKDSETRSYAKAIGLVEQDRVFENKIAEDRLELIKAIIADQQEDPLSKVTAVRLLLKH